MNPLVVELVLSFFIAMGVVMGGSVLGGLGAFLMGELPLQTMAKLAERLKLWGLVAALGGTFFALQTLETGFLKGQPRMVIRQILFILSAFWGAHAGYLLIRNLTHPLGE